MCPPEDADALLERSEAVSITVVEVAQPGLDDARHPEGKALDRLRSRRTDGTTERLDDVGVPALSFDVPGRSTTKKRLHCWPGALKLATGGLSDVADGTTSKIAKESRWTSDLRSFDTAS